MQMVAWWANTKLHNEAWEQAKVETGAETDVRAIARRAQEILTRANSPAEPEDERLRRTR